ncbi:MAG TPA: carbohydrate kinase family protein [Anaerolineaceae bacterium]|nr:carbohydrate kinase family protein [Anaerolineaceae bacterium]
MNIVCTGSIAYDYLMTFPGYFKDHIIPGKLESISLSFLVDSMVRQHGGIAANIAYGLALLGERPYLFGTVGQDFEEYRVRLENQGVDTRGVTVIPEKYTASFFANTDLSNAQISSFYTGAMADSANLSMHDLPFRPDLVVISPNDPRAMNRYVAECIELGYPYLYDPSQQLVRMDPADIRRGTQGAYALFVNDYEFELLKKHTGLTQVQILNQVAYMVVTCGEEGARIFVKDREYHIPVAPPQQIADPTGVGDAFRGGFLTGYRLNLDWDVCGRLGALAATYCLEQHGTQNHAYTPAEFVERYQVYFGVEPALDVLLRPEVQKPAPRNY